MAKTNWFWWLALAGWMCAGSWWHMCHVKQLCVPVDVAQAPVPQVSKAEPLPEMPVASQSEQAVFEPVELHFQTGSDVYMPAPAAGDFVGRVKQFLASGDKTISIYGHADNSGNPQANVDLSLARAERVKKELVAAGIPADRLIVKAMGQQAPQATNDTPEGRAQNRRVSIVAE